MVNNIVVLFCFSDRNVNVTRSPWASSRLVLIKLWKKTFLVKMTPLTSLWAPAETSQHSRFVEPEKKGRCDVRPDNNPVLDTSCYWLRWISIWADRISHFARQTDGSPCKDHSLMTLLFHTAGPGKRNTQAKHTYKTVCHICDGEALSRFY